MTDPRRTANAQANETSQIGNTLPNTTGGPDQSTYGVEEVSQTGGVVELPAIPGYRVLKKIGEGGMGSVYLAEDTKLQRQVAIKTMRAELAQVKANRERFEREARAAAAVDHENIVPIWQIGDMPDGSPYIAMPFLQGEPLDVRLKRQPVAGVGLILKVAREVADGLAAAHARGLIHRDIKPANVWIEGDPKSKVPGEQVRRCKILDFGLARSTTKEDVHLTASGAILGTPAYMAPEQAMGEKVDHRADIFSLGSMLYRMATGRLPYDGPTMMSVLIALTTTNPPSASTLNANLPPAVVALIDRLMAKDPATRPQSAAEVSTLVKQISKDLQTKKPTDPNASMTAAPAVQPTPSVVLPSAVPVIVAPVTADPSRLWEQATESTDEDIEPKPKPKPKAVRRASQETEESGSGKRRRLPYFIGGGVALLGFVVLLAVVILRMETAAGTLVVEIKDSEVEARIKNGKLVLVGPDGKDRYTITPTERNKKIDAGAYTLRVEGADGLSLDTREFTLKKGGQVTVRVTLDPKSVAKKDEPLKKDAMAWQGWPTDAPKPAIAPFDAAQAKAHQEAWAKYLGVPVEFTNSIGMKFRLIPPGEFMMGGTPKEVEDAFNSVGDKYWQKCIMCESPQHKVVLTQPIYLGVHEVTQADYETVMKKNPSYFSKGGPEKRLADLVAGLDTSRHPVENVSWNDAAEFCARLSELEKFKPYFFRSGETVTMLKEGTGYRLPTEAEWEFACRAGTTTKYWFGDKDEDLVQAGWSSTKSGGRTHRVGELNANPLGLHDMYGNVWEMLQDWWDPTYYEQFREMPAHNPNGPSSGSNRASRGGSYSHNAPLFRSSFRHNCSPTISACGDIGFRVSLTVDAVKAATATASPGKAIDILALVDVPGDCLKGQNLGDFTREGRTLVSPAGGNKMAAVNVRYELPPEYELTAVVECPDGDFGVWFAIVVGGHLQEVAFDIWHTGRRVSGLTEIDGKDISNNETTFKERVLPDRKQYTIRITVGKRSVRATVDEREIIRWEGDPSRFGTRPKGFAFASAGSKIKFHKLELRPISPSDNSSKLFMHDPAFPQWLKDVQAMPAEKQIEAVSKKLMDLNPGFDGKLYQFYNDGIPQGVPKIENGVVTELHFFTKRVTDISPVRALKGLKVLSAIMGEEELTDISPLQGMQLTTLFLWANAKLSDLSPLAGMPLTFLIADFTSVSDLSPLKGMKFTVLRFAGTKVTDISLIREMPLKDLNCNFQPERDTELLKSIKTLERINGKPAAEFWKEVEEQKKK